MSTAPIAQGPVECRVMPHTPGPWKIGEFDEHLGYDCMTCGVRAGPAVLDGSDYGQKRCAEIAPEAKARMLADASLIAAAPDLLAALNCLLHATMHRDHPAESDMAVAAIAKATLRHNVQVTGAARLHRAASSDRRERGRPAGYASLP